MSKRGISPKEVEIRKASEFVDRVTDGEDPQAVGKELGINPKSRTIQDRYKEKVEELRSLYEPDAAERRKILIARMTQIVALGEDKDAVAAGRVLTGDPEMGFATQTPGGINITLEVLQLQGTPQFRAETIPVLEGRPSVSLPIIDVTPDPEPASNTTEEETDQ